MGLPFEKKQVGKKVFLRVGPSDFRLLPSLVLPYTAFIVRSLLDEDYRGVGTSNSLCKNELY